MKKRMLALCLAVALLLGMVPSITLFSNAETIKNKHSVAYAEEIKVDGTLNEKSWLLVGKMTGWNVSRNFGSAWGPGTLYLAVKTEAKDTVLTVKLGNHTLTVNKSGGASGIAGAVAAWGAEAVEISVPAASIGLSMTNYDQAVAATLSMGGATWTGSLVITGTVRVKSNFSLDKYSKGDLDNLSYEVLSDGYLLSNKYVEGAGNFNQETGVAAYQFLSETGNDSEMFEFTFQAISMPGYGRAKELKPQDSVYGGRGLIFMHGNDEAYGINGCITNSTDKGLILFILGTDNTESYRKFELNRKVGDIFHIRFERTAAGKVSIYVDDELLAELNSPSISTAWGRTKNVVVYHLYSGYFIDKKFNPTADGKNDLEVKVTDIRTGYFKENLLEELEFDAIKGENELPEVVNTNLNLMTSWTHPMLGSQQKITWTSSNPSVISNTGVVKPTYENEKVDLIASCAGYTKKFSVIVPKKSVQSYFTAESMATDGALNEITWRYANFRSLAALGGEGAPTGSIAAVMKGGIAYMAVKHTGAKTMTLTMGAKQWTIDLTKDTFEATGVTAAIKDGVVELQFDMKALDMPVLDYGQEMTFQLALSNDAGTSTLDAKNIVIIFAQIRIVTPDSVNEKVEKIESVYVALPTGSANSWFGGRDVASNSQTNDGIVINQWGATDTSRQYWCKHTVSATPVDTLLSVMNFDKDILLEQILDIDSMPLSTGKYDTAASAVDADGYQILLEDNSGRHVSAVVYNGGSNKLKLKLRLSNTGTQSSAIDLGKKVGGDPFKLGIERKADGKVNIYVDGELKGSVDYGTVDAPSQAKISLVLTWNAKAASTTKKFQMKVTDLKLTVTDVDQSGPAVVQLKGTSADQRGDCGAEPTTTTVNIRKGNTQQAYWARWSGLERLGFDKNMYIEQTIKINKMPVSDGTTTRFDKVEGYQVLLANTGVNVAVFIYNDGNGLKAKIQKNNTVTSEAIDLGKALGEQFVLGIKRDSEGTVTVYVDDEEKGSMDNALYGATIWNRMIYRLAYYGANCSSTNTIDMTVSNQKITVTDGAGEDAYKIPLDKALIGGFEGAVTGTMEVDRTGLYAMDRTAYWVLQTDVDHIDFNKNMYLEQKIRVDEMPVGDGVFDQNDPHRANGYNNMLEWHAPDGKIHYLGTNLFNSGDGLKLRVILNNNQTAVIDLGVDIGDTFVLGMQRSVDDVLTVLVNGVEVGVVEDVEYEFGSALYGRTTLTGSMKDLTASTATRFKMMVGNIRLIVEAPMTGEVTAIGGNVGNDTYGAVCTENSIVLDGSKMQSGIAGWYLKAPGAAGIKTSALANIDADMLMEQTLKIDALAESNGKYTSVMENNGYVIQMEDYASGTSNLYSATVYNGGNGKLYLRFMSVDGESSEPINLGKKLGDTFKLGILWRFDNTVVVYVNDIRTASVDGYIYKGASYFGRSTVGMYTSDTTAKITVTDFRFTEVEFDVWEDMPSLGKELSAEVLLPGVNLQTVSSNLTFPAEATSQWLGKLNLSWSSSVESVMTSDGKVTRPNTKAKGWSVLSCYVVGGNKIWEEEVGVPGLIPVVDQTPVTVRAPFTKNVTINWSLNNKILKNAVKVGNQLEGTRAGVFGVQWNLTHIVLAVKPDQGTVVITVNGRNVVATEDNSYTKDGVTYILVPYSSVGLKTPTNYNMEVPMKFTIGDALWEGTVILTSNENFDTLGENSPVLGSFGVGKQDTNLGMNKATGYQSAGKTSTGFYFVDLYNPNGENPANIREYAIFGNLANSKYSSIYDVMGDRRRSQYVEFDFYAEAMPVYEDSGTTNWSITDACYGLTWAQITKRPGGMYGPAISMGIYNSKDGLKFAVVGVQEVITLNKYVGDKFRISTYWEPDDSLTLYIDGVKFANIKDAVAQMKQYGDRNVIFNHHRNLDSAQGERDTVRLYIDNISIGIGYGDDILDAVDYDAILGSNTDEYEVTKKLKLNDYLEHPQTDWELDITWSSSDENVVTTTGKVIRPRGVGKLVNLTATSGTSKKTLEVYVECQKIFHNVMYVFNDTDTANGAGQKKDFYEFTLDENNNSIIYDQEEIKRVNVITLTDSDDVNRLNESVLSIWVSNDNKTYERVDLTNNFKILRDGNKTYLYDFVATGRYIKVHCMHYNGDEADFIGKLEDMITVSYQDVFGATGGFAVNKTVTVNNPKNYICYDDAWKISLSDAGVKAGTEKSIRVYLGDELLYHYVEGSNIIVRIPEIAAKGSVKLTVLSGNSKALDISNREAVHEVVYGTREIMKETGARRWSCTLPDGRVISIATGTSPEFAAMSFAGAADYIAARANFVTYAFSEDGGLTFGPEMVIPATWSGEVKEDGTLVGNLAEDGWMNEGTGIMYDPDVGDKGRIIVTGFYFVRSTGTRGNSLCLQQFVYSDDLGETWHRSNDLQFDGDDTTRYNVGYSDPIRLSTFDGDGPNVDYIMSCAVLINDQGGFAVRPIYTCDAGITWVMSASIIDLDAGEEITNKESGTSEGWITERESDGVLVLHSRCQYGNSDRLAIAFSYDHGKTWTKAELSKIYGSSNQVVINDFCGEKMVIWGGNHALGTNSYFIAPMTFGTMSDDLLTVTNMLDTYSRLSVQGMTFPDEIRLVNQAVDTAGNTLTMHTWSYPASLRMRIDSIYEYYYRTKGAYDSFENSTVKYEGWSVTSGRVEVSNAKATDGKSSMMLASGGNAVRSVPYLQNGCVSFNLYVEDASTAKLEFELEAAYAHPYGKAAPVAFKVRDGKLYFLDSENASGLSLKNGWNTVTININLAATKPSASISVNGGTAMAMPVNTDVELYVCYVDVRTEGTYYMDAFTVTDSMAVELPEKPEEPDRCLMEHKLVKTAGIPVTVNFDGISSYWTCEACGKQFLDEKGTVEFTDMAQLHIPKLGNGGSSSNPETQPTDPSGNPIPVEESGVNVVLIVALAVVLAAAIATGGVILYRKKKKETPVSTNEQ